MKAKYLLNLAVLILSLLQSMYLLALDIPQHAKIYVAGHKGLVGSAVVQELTNQGYTNILARTSSELDLRDQAAVNNFFATEKPDFVVLAAAKVGGIKANMDAPAQFIYDNTMIAANVMHAAYVNKVTKLLFLGSSCIYPKKCPQPIKEEYLLSGPLEPSNAPYALAKITGLMMAKSYNRQYGTNFISCMPTNLYGINDNYDLKTSHVIPALIAKIVAATKNKTPEVEIWGTGNPKREFLHVRDLAKAAVFLLKNYDGNETINVGCGQDISIRNLAYMIKDLAGYQGKLVFNTDMPDGTPRKLLDVHKLTDMGWQPSIPLHAGLKEVIVNYQS